MIATYRGVKYDTSKFDTKCQQTTVQETYRGIKHEENKRVCKWTSSISWKKLSRKGKDFFKLKWLSSRDPSVLWADSGAFGPQVKISLETHGTKTQTPH